MKWPAKDTLLPVLLVCFVYPILAGLWWNYLSGHAEPTPFNDQPVVRVAQASGGTSAE